MRGIHFSDLPLSAKVFCTLFLIGIGFGLVAAFVQAATAVGVTPEDVKSSLAPEMKMTSLGPDDSFAEAEIHLGETHHAHLDRESAKVWLRTPLLIQTSHTHLFGQTLIAGILGLIFLFSSLEEWKKAAVLSLPFLGTLVDIGGMWLTRFVWSQFAFLVLLGGSTFALGYTLIASISLYELWIKKES